MGQRDDEWSIEHQLKLYCRAMDRCDTDLGRDVFFADAIVDYGTMYQGTGHGFVDFSTKAHGRFDTHLHRISNVIIDVRGDKAASETYVDAQFRLREGEQTFDLYTCGRYLDRWERREGRWAIVFRRYINAMSGRRPIADIPFAGEGSRDGSDPSYALFAQMGEEPRSLN